MATDLNALRLYAHFDEGTGPVIVMLHGINSDGGDWRTVIDTIGNGYRFIAFDELGFGKSPKPLDIDYSADDHALTVENTLQDMGVNDPFLLVGYSLGGDIALRYASTYPDRVRRLFLLDAPFYLPPYALPPKDYSLKYLYESVSKWLWNMLATSKARDSAVYRLATGVIEAPLKDAFHTDDISTHWEIMGKNLENTVNAATWVDDLPKLSMPVVHAIGVRDAIVKVGQAPDLKRLKPDLEIRRIGGWAADHMVLWNMPERVAEEIMRDEIRELNVAWRGGSGEPLVLLHGLQSAADAWVPAAKVLARTNDVAVVDLLGFGDSPAPLSYHYTLADHVAAVLGTVNALWGAKQRVRFAGDGFGATVALGCAATVPDRSAGVIAFSPALLEPGTSLEDITSNDRAARASTFRDMSRRLANDERANTKAAEKVERQLIPLVRSFENAILSVNSAELLAGVPAPTLFVIPSEDTLPPRQFISSVCSARDGFEEIEVAGDAGLPFSTPAEAVRAINPGDAEGIALAVSTTAAPNARAKDPLSRVAGDLEGALLRTGLLNLAAAVLIVLFHPVSPELLTYGFAAWATVASLSAIVGAFAMKHRTAGTRITFTTTALPTLLLGIAGITIAVFVVVDPSAARRLLIALIAVYAMARGGVDLYVATRVEQTAKPRWMLYGSATLGLITTLAVLFGRNQGVGLVRVVLVLYLGMTGVSLLAYVRSIRRDAKRRMSELLSD